MKLFYRFFLTASFIFLSLLFWKGKKNFFSQPSAALSITLSRQHEQNSPQVSANHRGRLSVSSSKTAAPLHAPSNEELQEFPGARVVEAAEVDGPHPGQKIRMRILETHFKDPYIRTEETIDQATGTLLHRTEMVATHLLVRLPAEEDPEAFLNQLGPDAIALERVTAKEPLYCLKLDSHSLATLPQMFHEITNKQLPVLMKEPDFLVHAMMKPNNPLYSQQWYLWPMCRPHIEGPWDSKIFFSGIDASDAWNIRTSAASVVVAVIDTGIRYTHEDLAANMWHESDPVDGTICGWNFSVLQDDPKKSDPMDGFGHGTACAGIIGAVGNSGVGVVGVAWNVKLMALKFLNDQGTGAVSDAVSAINFACDHGAKILNCSWGYVPPEEDPIFKNVISHNDSTVLQAAISRARDQGVIVVAAAGNEGKDNDLNPEYPANYPLDNIISVAATTEDNQLASFSSYGTTTVHLAAPGEEIFSTWARSDSDYIDAQTRQEILGASNASDVDKEPCGTSLSVPQVVGALALLKAQFPTWSYQQLITRVINTSDKIPSLAGKVVGGKLNVARALGDPL
ncbi:MAG: S8 family serine peptidase [Chthoniobacterales bacterium]|nr:S8 family serine peptidase [Chthoniobacterales bacterium]